MASRRQAKKDDHALKRRTIRPAIIGPLGPAQLACIRSWINKGWVPLFIHMGETRAPAMLRRCLGGYLHVADSAPNAVGRARILDFLNAQCATGVTTLSSKIMFWLHDNRASLAHNTALWFAPRPALDLLESKSSQLQIAQTVGLSTLPTVAITEPPPEDIPEDYFPLVLRPDDPSRIRPAFKMMFITNSLELEKFLNSLSCFDCVLLGQHFIHGPNLVVHGVRTTNGKHRHLAAFYVKSKLNGVSLTAEPTNLPSYISEGCKSFVDRIGHIGVYHFEFLQDPENGRYYFLEINGRLGGTTGKVFAAGYNEPSYLVEAFDAPATGSSNTSCTPLKSGVYSNKRSIVRALANVIRGQSTVFDYPWGSSKRALLPLALGLFLWHDEIFRRGYMRTALAYTIHSLIPKRRTARSR